MKVSMTALSAAISRALVLLLSSLLRAYQLAISPALGPHCRFAPSCSEYTRQSIERYGAIAGLWRGAKRIVRCHPFHPGGWDPVH